MQLRNQVRFDGRVAIVTGGGRGLGREYALLLASRGAKVVVNDVGGSIEGVGEDVAPAWAVADEINQAGGIAVANTESVAERDGAASIVRSALDKFGRVDIVINNAGIVSPGSFESYTDDARDRHIDVHLKGAWNVTHEAWPHMRRERYGRIVMIFSGVGLFGRAGSPAYCAVKGALVGLTRALALEGAEVGIKVNALGPAGFTRMTGELDDAKARAWFERHLKSSLVAPGTCWLAHEECPVTGRLFTCFGGRMAAVFVAEAEGFMTGADEFTLEAVRDNWDKVAALEPYIVPSDADEAVAYVVKMIRRRK